MISIFMNLSASHVFNCIVLKVNFGLTSYGDIPPALHLTTYNFISQISVMVQLLYSAIIIIRALSSSTDISSLIL